MIFKLAERLITIRKTIRSEVTAHSFTLLRAHILNINTCTYYIQQKRAHGHELISGCVLADAYNLMLIFASYYYDTIYTGLLLTSLLLHEHAAEGGVLVSGAMYCISLWLERQC